jgi:hypothetical protein
MSTAGSLIGSIFVTRVPALIGMPSECKPGLQLERAYVEHSCSLCSIAIPPEFRPLRQDPYSIDLVTHVGSDPTKATPHRTP